MSKQFGTRAAAQECAGANRKEEVVALGWKSLDLCNTFLVHWKE